MRTLSGSFGFLLMQGSVVHSLCGGWSLEDYVYSAKSIADRSAGEVACGG